VGIFNSCAIYQPWVWATHLCNGFLGHLEPRLPHLATSVKSLHGFDLRCSKDDIHGSKSAWSSWSFWLPS